MSAALDGSGGDGIRSPTPPRKVGRPKGVPKAPLSGKHKGVAVWDSDRVRDEALPHALALLLDVVRGNAVLVDDGMRTTADKQSGTGVWRRPTMAMRIKAAETILSKTLPDLKATELVASVGVRDETPPPDLRTTARAIVAVLSAAGADDANSETPTPLMGSCGKGRGAALSPTEKKSGGTFDKLSISPASAASVVSDGMSAASATSLTPHPASTGGIAAGPEPLPTSAAHGAKGGDGPSTSPCIPESDVVQIGSAAVMLVAELRDGRQRWAIIDGGGRIIEAHHLSREAAEAQCHHLVEDGVI